jgi:hypothetical protein
MFVTIIAKNLLEGTARVLRESVAEEKLSVGSLRRDIARETRTNEVLILRDIETGKECFLPKKY